MRALVYRGINDLRIETVPVPSIKSDELLVKVAVCGVCPTDIKKIQYGTVAPPRIFGHETAGKIVSVGTRVKNFRVGERVGLHHHVPCLKCHVCKHGSYAQCETYKRTGITAGFEPSGGGYAEYVRVMPFVFPGIVRIPTRNTFVEGAMLEPVNTVLKAINRLNLLRGDHVLVAGQGPIGLMFTRLLALRGINVIASDLLKPRLQLAKKFGAKLAINADTPDFENIIRRASIQGKAALLRRPDANFSKGRAVLPRRPEINFNLGGAATPPYPGLDAAIIAVPSDDTVLLAEKLIRGGGQILLFAHTRRGTRLNIDPAAICVDEKDLIGSYSSDVTLQAEAARLIFSRKLDIRQLVTHQFPLQDASKAIQLAAKPTPESLKIVCELTRRMMRKVKGRPARRPKITGGSSLKKPV